MVAVVVALIAVVVFVVVIVAVVVVVVVVLVVAVVVVLVAVVTVIGRLEATVGPEQEQWFHVLPCMAVQLHTGQEPHDCAARPSTRGGQIVTLTLSSILLNTLWPTLFYETSDLHGTFIHRAPVWILRS